MDVGFAGSELLANLVECLERSGSQALSIRYSHHSELLGQVLECSERWKYLRIRLDMIDDFSLVKGKLPRLETLEIHMTRKVSVKHCNVFEVAPMLRHICIYNTSESLSVAKIPWDQIQSLDVNSVIGLDSIFASAPQLSKLSLRLLSVSQLGWDHIFAIPAHSNITTLNIESVAALEKLEIPSLDTLNISDDACDSLEPITHFITRSSCFLQTINLSWTYVQRESEFRALMENIPSLLNLTIQASERGQYGIRPTVDWDIVARVLTISPSQPRSVPRLRNIAFVFHRSDPRFDFSLLLGMLESQAMPEIAGNGGMCRLASISLYDLPDLPQGQVFTVLSRLYNLRSSGIQLNLDPTMFHRMMYIGETYHRLP
ncbi:hypothetical protein H0H81_011810 [Sphagnurus paluster]|uniref:Uncharacterized protein n=1 Tax=Sphagnurus paluster TaxID=117069 RepID=A0A9P7FUX7_9AGAR|nr:hypothetical protein H0H81_011810 [Sphagnurus paluster]